MEMRGERHGTKSRVFAQVRMTCVHKTDRLRCQGKVNAALLANSDR